jgi:hypothetical protein
MSARADVTTVPLQCLSMKNTRPPAKRPAPLPMTPRSPTFRQTGTSPGRRQPSAERKLESGNRSLNRP